MAERTVRVKFLADVGVYKAKLAEAGRATSDFRTSLMSNSRESNRFFREMGHMSLLAGGGLVAGFGLATAATLNFDKQLSELAAVSGTTGDELGRLREQAIQAGKDTAFSASEAAKAQTELAKAGVSTADILGGGLTGALNLAAAGQLDLGRAAEISASAMTTFGLEGKDVTRIADALAAGANKSAADVEDMALALSQSGLVADQFGLSLEETVGVLSMFAQNGLKGSDAGTSFKTMLQRLVPSSVKAKEEMERLGIEMFDAQGNFVGVDEAAQELQDGLGDLSQEQRAAALTTIFGSDAIRAATIFYEGGAAGVNEWTGKVTDSGFAADVAATKMDNLAGDLEKLRGSIETALIEGGSKATSVLRGLTQGLDTMVSGFAEMPGALQGLGVGVAGIGGSALLAVGAIGTLVPKVREFKTALEGMGSVGTFVSNNLGKMTLALGGVGAALTVASFFLGQKAKKEAEAARVVDAYTTAINTQTGALNENIDSVTATEVANSDAAKAFGENERALQGFAIAVREGDAGAESLLRNIQSFGKDDALEMFIDDVEAGRFELTQFSGELVAMIQNGELTQGQIIAIADALGLLRGGVETATTANERYNVVAEALGVESKGATGGVDALGGALTEQEQAAEEAEKALKDYLDTLRGSFDPLFAMASALQGNRDALRDVEEAEFELAVAVAEHGAESREAAIASDALTEAQLRVAESALDVNVAAVELAEAMANQGLTVEGARAKLAEWVTQGLITQGQADTVAAAFDNLAVKADELDTRAPHIPVTADTSQANSALDTLLAKISTINAFGIGNVLSGAVRQSQQDADFARFLALSPADQARLSLQGLAGGGPVSAHRPYIVGEEGPELFVPNASGRIMASAPSVATGWGGGSSSYDNSSTVDVRIGQIVTPEPAPHAFRRELQRIKYLSGR